MKSSGIESLIIDAATKHNDTGTKEGKFEPKRKSGHSSAINKDKAGRRSLEGKCRDHRMAARQMTRLIANVSMRMSMEVTNAWFSVDEIVQIQKAEGLYSVS